MPIVRGTKQDIQKLIDDVNRYFLNQYKTRMDKYNVKHEHRNAIEPLMKLIVEIEMQEEKEKKNGN